MVRRAAWPCRDRSRRATRCWRRRRWAPISPISDRPSSRPTKPMRKIATSRASSRARRRISSIRTSSPACTAIICAVRSSRRAWILDNLPEGDLSTMNFGGGNGSKAKAWKDIWGSGQGIGVVDRVESVAVRVERLEREYLAARARAGRLAPYLPPSPAKGGGRKVRRRPPAAPAWSGPGCRRRRWPPAPDQAARHGDRVRRLPRSAPARSAASPRSLPFR